MAGKNPMGKMRPPEAPYLTVEAPGGWQWKILKAYQSDPNQPFARVFVDVRSPFTMGGSDMGDSYWADVNGNVRITQMDASIGAKDLPKHLWPALRAFHDLSEDELTREGRALSTDGLF